MKDLVQEILLYPATGKSKGNTTYPGTEFCKLVVILQIELQSIVLLYKLLVSNLIMAMLSMLMNSK